MMRDPIEDSGGRPGEVPAEVNRASGAGRGALFPAQVLIILFTVLFLDGSGGLTLEKRVREAVRDADRAEVAAEVATRIDGKQADVLHGIVELRGELFQALGRYDAAPSDWSAVLSAATALLAEGEDDLLRLRFELRDEMTEPEWNDLFAGMREDHSSMGW